MNRSVTQDDIFRFLTDKLGIDDPASKGIKRITMEPGTITVETETFNPVTRTQTLIAINGRGPRS